MACFFKLGDGEFGSLKQVVIKDIWNLLYEFNICKFEKRKLRWFENFECKGRRSTAREVERTGQVERCATGS